MFFKFLSCQQLSTSVELEKNYLGSQISHIQCFLGEANSNMVSGNIFFVQRYLFFSLICSTLRSNLLDMSSDHEHAVFLDTEEFKGLRLSTLKILDSQTHFKPIKTFKYAHFSSCHPCKTKKGFIKGEAFRRLRTNSVKENFNTYKGDLKQRLCNRAGLSHGARSWNLDWSSVLRQDKKLFVAKQRRRKKFYCLLPRYYHPRSYWILKRFSWNTGISV